MIIFGKRVCLYVLEKHFDIICEIYLSKEIDKKLFSKLLKTGKKITRIDNKKAQALSKGGNHQGILLKVKDFRFSSLNEIKDRDFLLVLSAITDSGNIGAIIRSAYALGADGVVITEIKSINAQAIARTSSGALFDMPVVLHQNGAEALNELKQKNFTIYAADIEGEDIEKISLDKKKVLVLGSEGEGITKRMLKRSDKKVTIKLKRDFDSLNVSAAAAILCYRMGNG